jgi:hypothetical protein
MLDLVPQQAERASAARAQRMPQAISDQELDKRAAPLVTGAR